jgi:hypothetical protein
VLPDPVAAVRALDEPDMGAEPFIVEAIGGDLMLFSASPGLGFGSLNKLRWDEVVLFVHNTICGVRFTPGWFVLADTCIWCMCVWSVAGA